MDEIAGRFATQANAPLVLDSTEPQVMEAGLQWIGGRAILNSANLEDGEAEGSRLDRVFKLAQEYGAAVICLLIDEEGQARDVEWKMRIAHRIADLAVDRYGLETADLIFDALTFPLSTGDDDLRRDAMATMEAIRRIKAEIPGVHTTLGVSNVSFGLNPAARHVLNSVFIHECVAGRPRLGHRPRRRRSCRWPASPTSSATSASTSSTTAGRRGRADRRRRRLRPAAEAARDLRRREGGRPVAKEDRSDWPVEQRLSQRIIDGDREGLDRPTSTRRWPSGTRRRWPSSTTCCSPA